MSGEPGSENRANAQRYPRELGRASRLHTKQRQTWDCRTQMIPSRCGYYRHRMRRKEKGDSGVVSKTRETEVGEKGEGSLSNFIVPLERWRICSRRATE